MKRAPKSILSKEATKARSTKPKAQLRSRRKVAVIISGMPSVGKTTAANAVAERFKLKHVAGGDMLKAMAIERGYIPSGAEWWDGEEGMRFLSEREKNPDFDKEVDRRLIENVRKGSVVITSYTVPWICKEGLKIWFAAKQSTRAKRLAGRDKIPFSKALSIIKKRDTQNRKLYKEIYDIHFGTDLSVFNYIVETDNITAKEVSAATCELVRHYKNSARSS